MTPEAARRLLASLGARPVSGAGGLELQRDASADPPRLVDAELRESRRLEVRAVPDGEAARVDAFLDGRQASQVVAHAGLVPLVHGHVGAVIRARHDRTLSTWRASQTTAIYLPRTVVAPDVWARCAEVTEVVDTSRDAADGPQHPLAWADRAYHQVQAAREALEHALAAEWVATQDGLLYVDGGIGKDDRVATSPKVVGVIKSHRTLYVAGDAVGLLASLRAGERTTAFAITSPRRTTVLSWYLRLRDPDGREPLFGLVRLEVATREGAAVGELTAHLDAISRGVLAERAPVALPDRRWAVMSYGIRDCEEYLRAVMA